MTDTTGARVREPAADETDGNEIVVRRFLDQVINGGHLDLVADLWAADLAWHGGSLGDVYGIDAYRQMLGADAGAAFTGMHLTIHEVISHGDKVVVRFTNSGTHTGTFRGHPATGRHAEWLGIGIYTVRDGRISEAWFAEDILGMLQQLGAVDQPG
ncbi:ester cyclase [Dactylosporangium sp. CA-233914]|uniref:ester cyclase n=1 Tax=Dactylosporangium sp. CA-233914 TaxID=3239934 RepID=UPI003D9301F5